MFNAQKLTGELDKGFTILFSYYGRRFVYQLNEIGKGIALIIIWVLLSVSFITSKSYADELAPNFNISTIDHKPFSLASFQGEKPVYLFFWATWCPICKKEIPRVKALQDELGDKIEILAINIAVNDSVANVKQYQKDHKLNYSLAFDQGSKVSKQYGVIGTPTQVVIDIDGNIRYLGHQYPVGLESFIKQLSTPRNKSKT